MRGLIVPEKTEDFTADPVELFFDLAFVFAFSQLVYRLVHRPDIGGVAESGLIFAMLWLPWTQFTWSANAVSGNSRVARSLFLFATAVSVPMAASVRAATEGGGPVFAITASLILGMGLATLAWGLETGSSEYRSIVRYSIPNVMAMVAFVVGGFLADDVRLGVWAVGVLVVLGGTIRAGSGDWIIRTGHFAERHSLIVIVALGEIIVAIGQPVVDALGRGAGLTATTVVSLAGAGVFGALLWWAYFDRPAPAFEHAFEALAESGRGRFARDVYTYAHAPIVIGVILSAAGIEALTLHPDQPLALAFRVMLWAGLTSYLLGVAIGVYRVFGVIAVERVVASAVGVGVLAVSGTLDGVVLLVIVDVLLVVMLVVEHRRIEHS